MTEETQETVQGNLLLKQGWNTHQCRRLLLQHLRYHITSVSGSPSTTRVVAKCQRRCSVCFDTILSASRRRMSSRIQNPVLCGSILCWYHLVPSSNSGPLWRKTHEPYKAKQRVVTERLRRAHISRRKLPRYALEHPIRVDSRWKRDQEWETDGGLYSRKSNVYWSLPRKELRRDEAQDCSVQKRNTSKHNVFV